MTRIDQSAKSPINFLISGIITQIIRLVDSYTRKSKDEMMVRNPPLKPLANFDPRSEARSEDENKDDEVHCEERTGDHWFRTRSQIGAQCTANTLPVVDNLFCFVLSPGNNEMCGIATDK